MYKKYYECFLDCIQTINCFYFISFVQLSGVYDNILHLGGCSNILYHTNQQPNNERYKLTHLYASVHQNIL